MAEFPFQTAVARSRRGFLKQGLGVGIGALTAGCGQHIHTTVGPSPPTPVIPDSPDQPPRPTDPGLRPLANPQPMPPGSLAQVSATVTSTQVGSMDSSFVGFSFEKGELVSRIFSLTDPNVLTLFKALGPGIMRIGGSSVDDTKWTPGGSGRNGGQISKIDIDKFAPFLRATGWQVIYGINLAQNTEADAAGEAEYVANALRGNLYCFSIGNEPGSYTFRKTPYAPPAGYTTWDYNTFRDRWISLRDAIIQKVPDATFSGADATGGTVQYTVDFARDIGANRLKVLAQHHYRLGDKDTRTLANLLTLPDALLGRILPQVKTAASSINVPFRITETNSVTSGGVDGVSNVYGSALWALDNIFTMALGGASGVHFHGGDTAKYSPFNFGSERVTDIRPLYYALLFSKMMGEGTLLNSTIDSGGFNLSVYAIKTASGFSVMLVNKVENQSFKITLQLPASVSRATVLQLTGPGLSSKTGIAIQNAQISLTFGLGAMDAAYSAPVFGQSVTVYVPALAAVLVKAS